MKSFAQLSKLNVVVRSTHQKFVIFRQNLLMSPETLLNFAEVLLNFWAQAFEGALNFAEYF